MFSTCELQSSRNEHIDGFRSIVRHQGNFSESHIEDCPSSIRSHLSPTTTMTRRGNPSSSHRTYPPSFPFHAASLRSPYISAAIIPLSRSSSRSRSIVILAMLYDAPWISFNHSALMSASSLPSPEIHSSLEVRRSYIYPCVFQARLAETAASRRKEKTAHVGTEFRHLSSTSLDSPEARSHVDVSPSFLTSNSDGRLRWALSHWRRLCHSDPSPHSTFSSDGIALCNVRGGHLSAPSFTQRATLLCNPSS